MALTRCDACNKSIDGPGVCPHCGHTNKEEERAPRFFLPALLSFGIGMACITFAFIRAYTVTTLTRLPASEVDDALRKTRLYTAEAWMWGISAVVALGLAAYLFRRHKREENR